jgi:hypothetical protein
MRVQDKQISRLQRSTENLLRGALALGQQLMRAFLSGGGAQTAQVPGNARQAVRQELFSLFEPPKPAVTATAVKGGVEGRGEQPYDGGKDAARALLQSVPSSEELKTWSSERLYAVAEQLHTAEANVREGTLSQELFALPPGTVLTGHQEGLELSVPKTVTVVKTNDMHAGETVDEIAKMLAAKAKSGRPQAFVVNGSVLLALPKADEKKSAADAATRWRAQGSDPLIKQLHDARARIEMVRAPKAAAEESARREAWIARTQRDFDALPKDTQIFANDRFDKAIRTPSPLLKPTEEMAFARNDVEVAQALYAASKQRGAPCAYLMNSVLMVVDARVPDAQRLAVEEWRRRGR